MPSNPYRHGKLIEWRTGDQWWSVTGSPNLSTAALCRTAATDGNVELAVLAPTDTPLLPAGALAGVDSVTQLRLGGKPTGRREVPLLLCATLSDDKVNVEFARQLPGSATLQVADPDTPPDAWPTSFPVDADVDTVTIPAQPPGSRVRLKLVDGRFSNTTFVADPIEVLTQPGRSTTRPSKPPPTIDDIFTNPVAGRRFLELLDELPRLSAPLTTPPTTAPTDPDNEQYTVGDWRDYLAAAETTLSAQLIAFALGRQLGDQDSNADRTSQLRIHDWDGADLRDAAGDLDDDDPDEAAAEAHQEASQYQAKQHTRAACWRNLTAASAHDPLRGLIKLRLMLTFIAAGGFDTHDTDWVLTILDTVKRIGELDGVTDLETELASLVAVALATTTSTLSPVITTAHHARQHATERSVAHLLAGAEPASVEQYGAALRSRFGSAVGDETVSRYVERIVNADSLDDAINDMRRAGFSPTRDGNRLEIVEDVTSPVGSALAAISRCRSVEVVSMMCRAGERWALAAWRHPHLLVLQPGANGRGWGAVYQLSGAGLGAVHAGELREISSREVEMFTPLDEPGELAGAVLAANGWTRDGNPQTARS